MTMGLRIRLLFAKFLMVLGFISVVLGALCIIGLLVLATYQLIIGNGSNNLGDRVFLVGMVSIIYLVSGAFLYGIGYVIEDSTIDYEENNKKELSNKI